MLGDKDRSPDVQDALPREQFGNCCIRQALISYSFHQAGNWGTCWICYDLHLSKPCLIKPVVLVILEWMKPTALWVYILCLIDTGVQRGQRSFLPWLRQIVKQGTLRITPTYCVFTKLAEQKYLKICQNQLISPIISISILKGELHEWMHCMWS